MTFKIGDYAVDKFGNIFHITNDEYKAIVNAASMKFRHATEKEIEKYHVELEEKENA